jgi:hypothetical protein
MRDEVAIDCAQYLRMAGQRDAGIEVAKRIGNPGKRDEMLKKLATG